MPGKTSREKAGSGSGSGAVEASPSLWLKALRPNQQWSNKVSTASPALGFSNGKHGGNLGRKYIQNEKDDGRVWQSIRYYGIDGRSRSFPNTDNLLKWRQGAKEDIFVPKYFKLYTSHSFSHHASQ